MEKTTQTGFGGIAGHGIGCFGFEISIHKLFSNKMGRALVRASKVDVRIVGRSQSPICESQKRNKGNPRKFIEIKELDLRGQKNQQ
jgi:hypothetical protein